MENETDQLYDQNQLWVNISSLSDGNVFGLLLPNLLKEMLGADLNDTELDENFQITLPSNYEWRSKNYFKLLERQKARETTENEETCDNKNMDGPLHDYQRQQSEVLHHWNIGIVKSERDKKAGVCLPDSVHLIRQELSSDLNKVKWSNTDLAKAGCLLSTPPIKVTFADEEEMRTVYTLIYDVFRYKTILIQTLAAIGFFPRYPALNNRRTAIWLLLFDLYHRNFKERKHTLNGAALKLFELADLLEIDAILWRHRVKLAASIARIRIKSGALRLNDLLPHHLKDERLARKIEESPLTCWINIKKLKTREDVETSIDACLQLKAIGEEDSLTPDGFKWDVHCPQFVLFHPSIRAQLTQSALVKKHKIILQDRSFCLGPATFGKLLDDMQLSGNVIQTHVNSPRTTAYLATLLSRNSNIDKLMAFSAGKRKPEYDQYFNELGVKNINIFSEKLIDVPIDANYLEEVSAVFATPPNSYTAVNDPIDLVCSRGGDLTMLEVLTETEETSEGKARVAEILDEQRKTLRFVMSRPQIQFVLYETHSELDIENGKMVEKAMKEINKIAIIHHANSQGKFAQRLAASSSSESASKEINNNEKLLKVQTLDETATPSESQVSVLERKSSIESIRSTLSSVYKNVQVPDTDLFDRPPLPDLCPNSNVCTKMSNDGCFLAVLQRKQITRMDNKYMIDMAEVRGLFGKGATNRTKSTPKDRARRQEKQQSPFRNKARRRGKNVEMNRIAAPTLSSTLHTAKPDEMPKCARCATTGNADDDYDDEEATVARIKKAANNNDVNKIEVDNNSLEDEEEVDDPHKIIPFYNIQVAPQSKSQDSLMLAPLIPAPETQEIDCVDSAANQIGTQTDYCLHRWSYVQSAPKGKVAKKTKEQPITLKTSRKKSFSLNSILKRVTLPTHASIIKANKGVEVVCNICLKRAKQSGLV